MLDRQRRQLVIIAIYAILSVLIVVGLYFLFRPDPTCFDGKQNQREQGIDCGGQCQACEKEIEAQSIRIEETAFVESTNSTYDILAKISNPNNLFGVSQLKYTITLLDKEETKLGEYSGESFVLPRETKSIILQGVELSQAPDDVQAIVEDVEWVQFQDYTEPKLRFVRKEFRPITSGPGYGEVYGLLRNDSTLDFHKLHIKITLRDEKDQIIALHTTEMNTITAGEERDFFLQFPEKFEGHVAKIEAEAEADVINAENYMRLYLPGGEFQRY